MTEYVQDHRNGEFTGRFFESTSLNAEKTLLYALNNNFPSEFTKYIQKTCLLLLIEVEPHESSSLVSYSVLTLKLAVL